MIKIGFICSWEIFLIVIFYNPNLKTLYIYPLPFIGISMQKIVHMRYDGGNIMCGEEKGHSVGYWNSVNCYHCRKKSNRVS